MLEVTKQPKEEIKYPVARKSREYGQIVLFFSSEEGVVIKPATNNQKYDIGYNSCEWWYCNDYDTWEPVDITITG